MQAGTTTLSATTFSRSLDVERLHAAATAAEQAVSSGSHPCALIAVGNSERTVWSHVVSGQNEVAEDSVFLLASITKTIVATAVMRLVEQGRLLLDVPVVRYIPEFGVNGKEEVTTWHLLTHTSGLDEHNWIEERRRAGRDQLSPVEAALGSYLHFEPGERCEYCSLSFSVLGELIHRLSGQPYPEYLRKHVFGPLGMPDTAFQPQDQGRALPVHDFGDASYLEAFSALALPGGGLWSTASDLISFGQAFLRGGELEGYRLLGPVALDTMVRLHTSGMWELRAGRRQPFHYGLGWGKPGNVGGLIGSTEAYGHGGATGTYFWVDPEYDLVCVFLTNRWGLDHEVARRIINAVYGAIKRT